MIPHRYRQLFLDTMNSDLSKLEDAIGSRDAGLARQVLHRMHGALLMMDMGALSSDVEAVEANLAHDSPDASPFEETSRLVLELRELLVRI